MGNQCGACSTCGGEEETEFDDTKKKYLEN